PLVNRHIPSVYGGALDNVFIHHDAASSHTAQKTQDYAQDVRRSTGVKIIKNIDILVKSPDASPMDCFESSDFVNDYYDAGCNQPEIIPDPAVVNDRNNISVCENLNGNILNPGILNPVNENVNIPGVNNVITDYADIPAINNPIPEIRNSNETEEPEPIPVPQNSAGSKRSVKSNVSTRGSITTSRFGRMSELPDYIIDELLTSDDDCVVIGQDAETEESLLEGDAP
ncbi:unnamed protein product, partial [Allacma fusca]